MKLPIFKLEDYFSRWEFKAPFLLGQSDAERWDLSDLLALADKESRKLWDTLHLGYTETQGLPLLRQEISALYSSLKDQQVLCFAGAEEGIFCAMNALIRPGDHVIAITPCYQSLETLPRSLQADVSLVALNPSDWSLDLDDMRRAMKPSTRLIVVNFPHNPTGAIIPYEILKGIIELARQCGAYVFSDEVYRDLEIEEKDRLPAVADLYEKGISLGVMSKAFGLAGLRIGWLACQDAGFLEQAAQFKHYLSICNSGPSEILALIGLRAKQALLARNRKIMRDNLALLDAFFARYSPFFHWVRPKGGCIGFPRLLTGKKNVEQFSQELIEQEGVLILPGSVYNDTQNHFRIGFGRRNMPEALVKLERFLENNRQALHG
ncbi:aminotransferase class I/II-fold pyridoxal phosphate-dependent enzyme [Candidatus Protochlamydia phocaeensis]|uniref:aminotransferase class I/II-fold pyridoxal phosphate-dependent enzyme n=1 Tax=Candidatus Protochlamydia phocaeensis TaxID=1414722 RepID=UPI0008399D70|nr:aminotransferase class I/II-fold pyridoxal phosphate-dependent enzyme [Candidatus Protochlamydia phocaeensis]